MKLPGKEILFIWLSLGVFSAASADPGAAGEAMAPLVFMALVVMGGVAVVKKLTGGSTPAPAPDDPNASQWSKFSPITKGAIGCLGLLVCWIALIAVTSLLAR